MTKLHVAWIVLIVFASLIIFAAVSYLFYRLYINRIYKKQRSWKEIRSPTEKTRAATPHHRTSFLQPRISMVPLIQEYLPHEMRRSKQPRRMTTALQFDEPPDIIEDFKLEWNVMDTQSRLNLFSFFFHNLELLKVSSLYERSSTTKVLIIV
jgi:hypothetical protein